MGAEFFTQDELTALAAEVTEFQQEANAFAAWCQTPVARAEGAELMREAEKAWAKFVAECATGKYDLSPEELERLREVNRRNVTP